MSNAVTALGLCDGTPEWWALWVEVLTRAPPFDDEDTDAFARARGLDPDALREAFAPSWYPQQPDPRPAHPWSAGAVVRWPYRYNPGPAPTDSCRYGDGQCDGSCGG